MSDEQRQAIEEILAAYSFEQWNELIPEIQAVLETSSRAVAVQAVRQLYGAEAVADTIASVPQSVEVRGYFDQVNTDAANFARERAAELVGRKWIDGELVDNPNAKWVITDSTREWLRESITSAFEDGMSPAKLGGAIRSSQAFTKSRAKMIAHTEIGNANAQTLEEASIRAGATDKRSFLSADHEHLDICDAAAEAGEVPIDHVYDGGYKRPLYHPRCQCSESYYVRKKKVPTQ